MTQEGNGNGSQAPSEGSGSAVRCPRCEATAPAGTSNCPTCGVFLPANEAALRHGLRRFQDNGTLPAEIREVIEAFETELIAAQGGEEELSREPLRRARVGKLVQLEAGSALLMREVVRRGIDSRPGRAAYGNLLATLDRWHRFAESLGMERRAKQVDPLERVRSAVREANA